MSKPLNVIALISGGKDSFYSLLHCLANGHNVVALANLYPPALAAGPTHSASKSGDDNDSHTSLGREVEGEAGVEEDLNSYMYQTVGHVLIPLFSSVLPFIPLYRGEIVGSARDTERDYHHHHHGAGPASEPSSVMGTEKDKDAEADPRGAPNHDAEQEQEQEQDGKGKEDVVPVIDEKDKDETESLVPLLRRIMAAHPEANAVCSGAILSTYQRTRIESVAGRLCLVSLSFLWQYPSLPVVRARVQDGSGEGNDDDANDNDDSTGLLRDMASIGLDARIVKVASGGLDGSFLWESLADAGVVGRLQRAVRRFGGSVLGEGGEYETLVVGGPRGLWKGVIELEEGERRVCKGQGGEASLGFREGAGRVMKPDCEDEVGDWKERFRIPELWDERFKTLSECDLGIESGRLERELKPQRSGGSAAEWRATTVIASSPSTFAVSNLAAPDATSSVQVQMLHIIQELKSILATLRLDIGDLVFTTILLRRMSDFATVNVEYATMFTKPNPPARVTVACGDGLPTGADVMIHVIASKYPPQYREGLHVQSQSYWAPANIGPYSQARTVPSIFDVSSGAALVYIAGQIPLVPATMDRFQAPTSVDHQSGLKSFHTESALSLQHLWRIGAVMNVRWWTGAIAFISGRDDFPKKAFIAAWMWRTLHVQKDKQKEIEDLNDQTSDVWDTKYGNATSYTTGEPQHIPIPDFDTPVRRSPTGEDDGAIPAPGLFVVQVAELPRDCSIEWQGLGLTRSRVRIVSYTEDEILQSRCEIIDSCAMIMYFSVPLLPSQQARRMKVLEVHQLAKDKAKKISGGVSWSIQTRIYTPFPDEVQGIVAQIVPCEAVWDVNGARIGAGIIVHSEI